MTWEIIEDRFLHVLDNMHFLVLQGGAIVGIVCVLLMLKRGTSGLRGFQVNPGIALGVCGFILSYLVNASTGQNMNLYLRIDLAFLGGLLGGTMGGLAVVVLMSVAALMHNLHSGTTAIILDMGLVAAGGVILRQWLKARTERRLAWSEISIILGVRLVVSLLSPMFLAAVGVTGIASMTGVISMRIASAPVSLLLLVAIFGVLKWEMDRQETLARRERMSLLDPFTGFPNRLALHRHLKKLTRRGDGSIPVTHTLILIEAANLGDLVAQRGHDWGKTFWQRIEAMLRGENEFLGRYHPRFFIFADAFLAVVLHGISVAEARRQNLLPALNMRLERGLRAELLIVGGVFPRLNYGVAELEGGTQANVDMVMRNLSLALRCDDEKISYFAPSLAEREARDAWIRLQLVAWIENNTPPVHYQPKVDLDSGRIIGAESLLRLRDADGKSISPMQILRVAGQQQSVVEFEWSTLEAAVRDLRYLQTHGWIIPFAVNVSAASLETAGFAPRLLQLLDASRVSSEWLVLELTEQRPLPDNESVRINMMLLHMAGVRLSLDDFGTGHSALALLAQYPFSEVKIDRSMVDRLAEQPRMQVAVSLALESAQRYQAELVAEGVETPQEADTLMRLGVKRGQGYLFGRAMPLSSLMHLKVAQDEGLNANDTRMRGRSEQNASVIAEVVEPAKL